MLVEICVDSVSGAIAAQKGGADRVELCDNLWEGGTTPSAGQIKLARQNIKIGLNVIIRPRGGDFLFNDVERAVMKEDIIMAKQLGADAVVIGCLTANGDIDVELTGSLMEVARPLSVTFHRAFDMCRDPHQALETLISLKVDRVLTSGQEATCLEGIEMLVALNKQAAGRIIVMPGGGLTARNIPKIVQATSVSEIHLSARTQFESGMQYRNSRCFMGGVMRPAEFSWKVTDENAVRTVCSLVK